MAASNFWIADVPISLPSPPPVSRPVVFTFDENVFNSGKSGFGMTTGGIAIAWTDVDKEEIMSHFFSPPPGSTNGG